MRSLSSRLLRNARIVRSSTTVIMTYSTNADIAQFGAYTASVGRNASTSAPSASISTRDAKTFHNAPRPRTRPPMTSESTGYVVSITRPRNPVCRKTRVSDTRIAERNRITARRSRPRRISQTPAHADAMIATSVAALSHVETAGERVTKPDTNR